MTQRKQAVAAYVRDRLKALETEPNDSYVRAQLAKLRRGVGRKPGDLPELWGMLFATMPEEMLSQNGEPTRAEWAVYTALTLYAVHQQGGKIGKENMHQTGQNGFEYTLGRSVGRLVKSEADDRKRIARRFNAFATASSMEEAVHYLRGLIQLLHAEKIPLDYVKLAENLYDFQNPAYAQKVRLVWGQDFYVNARAKTEENEEKKG